MTSQESGANLPFERLAFLEAVHAASPIMAALLNCETDTYEYIDPSVEKYLGYTRRGDAPERAAVPGEPPPSR